MMICINRFDTDPYFNIAAEEYILKTYNEDVMMLWQNQASVIIGKHQNALSEVNFGFIEENNIPFIRRISGGGTVYHDLNNINYTLIKTEKRKDRLIDFNGFLKPIVEFLETFGITSSHTGKNNLSIGKKKISGNSAHVFKSRVLHHGTLLFNTDLDVLDHAIKPSALNVEDKAVQSIRKEVVNIRNHLADKLTVEEFKFKLQEFLLKYHNINEIINLSKTDYLAIQQLAEKKYKTWDWNYGYSPKYTFHNQSKFDHVTLEVKNGIIINASFSTDFAIHNLISHLVGLPHQKDQILNLLNEQINDQNKVTEYAKLLGF